MMAIFKSVLIRHNFIITIGMEKLAPASGSCNNCQACFLVGRLVLLEIHLRSIYISLWLSSAKPYERVFCFIPLFVVIRTFYNDFPFTCVITSCVQRGAAILKTHADNVYGGELIDNEEKWFFSRA